MFSIFQRQTQVSLRQETGLACFGDLLPNQWLKMLSVSDCTLGSSLSESCSREQSAESLFLQRCLLHLDANHDFFVVALYSKADGACHFDTDSNHANLTIGKSVGAFLTYFVCIQTMIFVCNQQGGLSKAINCKHRLHQTRHLLSYAAKTVGSSQGFATFALLSLIFLNLFLPEYFETASEAK